MKTFPTSRRRIVIAALACATAGAPLFAASARNNRSRPQPQLVSMFARESTAEVTTDALAATPDAWQNIQYFPYDKRREFTAIFARMVARLDEDIRGLNDKRATMKNDTTDWDFAMKELNNARANVQSRVTELSRATTPDAWEEARERLGVAWERAQTAVQAVRKSTTS